MFGYFKKRKFNKWCDYHNLKNKNPHYFKYFTLLFERGYKLYEINNLYKKLMNSNNLNLLPQNPVTYDDPNHLIKQIDYVDNVVSNIRKSPFKSTFNSENQENKFKMVDLCRKGDLKNLFPEEITSIESFCKKWNLKFKNTNQSRKSKLLSAVSKDKKVKLIYNQDNIVIIQVLNTKSAKVYGAKPWCIKDKKHWDEYVGKKSQYFVFNFNYHPDYDWFLLGFTIKNKSCDSCKCVRSSKVHWIFDQENKQLWYKTDGNFEKDFKYSYDNQFPVKAFKLIKKSIKKPLDKNQEVSEYQKFINQPIKQL
jgi:hypothetical protein